MLEREFSEGDRVRVDAEGGELTFERVGAAVTAPVV
jgi:hypothetical protein